MKQAQEVSNDSEDQGTEATDKDRTKDSDDESAKDDGGDDIRSFNNEMIEKKTQQQKRRCARKAD